MIVVVLGVPNPTIEIVDRWVWSKGVVAYLRPTRISELRSPEVFIIVGRQGVASSTFTSQGLDMGFTRGTRHDEEEGDGEDDKSKEVSDKGNFKRRH